MTALYTDPDTGKKISTHSMIKAFRRCPKQAEYKYVERLKPKVLGRPIRLGTWMHKLQEVHGRGEDWREAHEEMVSSVWAKLWDEEKDDIGNLPDDCARLMRSYLWHYANDEWKYHDTEFMLECELPDGSIYRCKIDALVENQYGLYLADRKWHRNLPDSSYRIRDSQSGLYLWCALKNKIPVQGFIWDYGRSKPPTIPMITKTGLVGRWDRCDTDFPTMVDFFKREFEGKVPQRYRPKMRYLRSLQYVQGSPQSSSFFFRSVMDKSKAVIKRVAQEGYHTHIRMHSYPYDRPEIVERVPDRSCSWCDYRDLCAGELLTGTRPLNWQRNFRVGDPMDYYYDELPVTEEN